MKNNSVNPLYLIINKINEYFKEMKGNKYLALVSTDESKEIINKYEVLWSKIKDQIRAITTNSENYDKKYI